MVHEASAGEPCIAKDGACAAPLNGRSLGGHAMATAKPGLIPYPTSVAPLLVLLTFACNPVLAGPDSPVQLTVQIVPTHARDGRQSLDLSDSASHFHVVIANVSKDPIRVWKEWCSWGYEALTFEALDVEGRPLAITKLPGEWDKNYPDPFEVVPGGQMVIDVSLAPSTWQNSPLAGASGKADLRLKAVYEIRPDKESERMRVWTGRAVSPSLQYTLYWTPGTAKALPAEVPRRPKKNTARQGVGPTNHDSVQTQKNR